ncbi:MAG TPA: ATP-binding protein [Sediminibacterium sp.]|uniref:tetratricopeptide repeat-containing sensor histidine kinase n=1 Tax=Sediminibacterium sp. TaxID=1917865 RepID=UPI000B018C6B|nr:ATP-binding protein [Sediminibacterium sp.]HLD52376.1 ATP-binding protein [Sediminibacterium sp.]
MKNNANLLGLFLSIFIWGCSTNQDIKDWDNNESFVDSVLNQISKQKNTTKRSEIMFLDSAIKKKSLSLKQQLQVYAYKSGLFCYYLQKLDSAKLYADSMNYLLKDKDPNDYPNAFTYTYYTIGDAMYANNQFNEAYTYYFKARQFNTLKKDYCALKEYSYRIGMILYNQGEFKNAADNFKQSFSEALLCEKNNEYSNYYRKQELLNNIALCFYKLDHIDSALTYYNKALEYISTHQKADTTTFFYDEMAKGVVYGNIGDIHKKSGNIQEAERNFKKSIDINLHSGRETIDAQLSYLKLAELYAEKKEFTKLGNALAEIRISMNETPNTKGEIKWNKLSWKYFEQNNEKAKAHDYLVKFLELQDADEKINKKIYEVDINKQLELLEQQNQLHIAQHENEVSRTYLISIAVILFLIILLSIILGRNWLHSRKHISTLKELNETVSTQNEQLEIAMSALQKTISEKDSILKLVAHDLRTPVASIPTMVEIIIAEEDEAQKLEYLEMIKSACNSSLTLIAEIMATADISNKNIEKEPTLLNEFINDCAAILELKVKEKNQQLIVQLPDLDTTVMLNPEKMKRVIFNLVTNSVKFSKKDTTIILSAKTVGNKVFIEVADNGIGIPEKLIPEIFNISKSGKRKGTDGEKSYGLGLNICKRIVEAHDGSINVQSQEGKGSTFTVELPLS